MFSLVFNPRNLYDRGYKNFINDLNNNNNINNTNANVYGAVIMARPLREFTRFI